MDLGTDAVLKAVGESGAVTVLGLSFKPGTSDLRGSPALPVVEELRRRKASLTVHDPAALAEAEAALGTEGLLYCSDLAEAVAGAEAVVLVTRWPEYERLPSLLEALDRQPIVIDGRRMLDPESVDRYEAIGRGRSGPPTG